MSKIRTLSQLVDNLDAELAWRIQELSHIKMSIKRSGEIVNRAILRAAVPILYAHWEGFVKNASNSYLEYVSRQRLPYSRLKSSFVVLAARSTLIPLLSSNKMELGRRAVEFIRNDREELSKMPAKRFFHRHGMMDFSAFCNICDSLSIDFARYEARKALINESLVSNRNKIAHGEFLLIDDKGYGILSDDVIVTMRWYKDDIQNSAILKTFEE